MVVEHHVYDALQRVFRSTTPVIAKGLTAQAKAACIAAKLKPGWCCVGLDASRFDQCVQEPLLRAEHAFYKMCFPQDRLLDALLRCQLDNRGIGRCRDGYVKAIIGAMRCSGDQNTSLGNILIMCMLVRLFCAEISLVDYDVLNDGDDLLLFLPESSLPLLRDLSDWYLSWGLRMKVEPPARSPEQVEFCQARPVFDGREWVLVRNPDKVLNTDYAGCAKIEGWQQYLVHLRNVGICGMSTAAGIPVLQALYEFGIRHGKTGKFSDELLRTGPARQHAIQVRAGYKAVAKPIVDAARDSFERAFGISAVDQIIMEQHLSTMLLSRPDESDPLLLSTDQLPFTLV